MRPEAQAAGVGLVDLMVANKLIRPADVTQAKAAHFGAEVVKLNEIKIPDEVIAAVPAAYRPQIPGGAGLQARKQPDGGHGRPLGPGHHRQPAALAAGWKSACRWRRIRTSRPRWASITATQAGMASTDPRLAQTIKELTEEHVEVKPAGRRTAARWRRTRR